MRYVELKTNGGLLLVAEGQIASVSKDADGSVWLWTVGGSVHRLDGGEAAYKFLRETLPDADNYGPRLQFVGTAGE